MDKVIYLLENDIYPCYLLDGQSVMIEDYLAVKPENKERLKKLVSGGKLVIGPWYTVPDTFIPCGESLIKNLEKGCELKSEYGGAGKAAYTPDSFGLNGQFAQIVNKFGYEHVYFSRGARFSDSAASGKRSDLYLISKDGTKLLSECDKYSMGSGLVVPSIWKNFEKHKVEKDDAIRCVDWTFDYQSSRTFFKNRLWICGVDHLEPREDLPEIVSSLNEIYNDAEFKLSTIDAYFDAIAEETPSEKPLAAIGEQRGNYDKHYELSNTLSSRPDIKLLNREAENLMFGVFESLDIFPKPSKKFDFLDRRAIAEHAYKELLKSHAHDSICTCGSEETCADEKERLRGVKEVALELIKDDLSKIGSSLKRKTSGGEILVFNPLPFDRSEILEGYVSVPFDIVGDKLTDENGNIIDDSFVKVLFKKRIDIETIKYTEFAEIAADETRTYLPQNAGEEDIQTGVYYRFRAKVKALSFTRYGFADGLNANEKKCESFKNDCLVNVEISEQGDIAVGQSGGVKCEFYPVIDIDDGDSYTYANIEGKPCAKADEVFVETVGDNGLFTEKKVKYKFNDAGINKKTVELCLNLQFSKTDDSVKVSADIVNLDCYGFRLGLVQRIDGQAEYVSADTPFDLTKRPIAAKKDLSKDIFTCSMRNVLNVRLNNGSASVMSKSFQEYEAWHDEKHTFIRYTLLRSSAQVYNTFLPTKDESGAGKGMRWKSESLKMLGRNTFEFALKFYDTPKTETEILNDALKYQFPPIVKGIASDGNKELSDYEGLSIDGVVFSSIFERVKDNKKMFFARVYNPCDDAVVATARYKGASKKFAVERGKIYEMNLTTEFGIDGL